MEQIKLISSTRGELSIEEGSNTLKGYAARFNEPSKLLFENNKRFIEVIHREAVEAGLEVDDVDVILNYNHDDNKMLARYNPSMGSSTLKMEVRSEGLWVEAKLPDTEHGREVKEHMRNGNLYGMSFVYWTSEGAGDVEWSRSEDGILIRNVMNIRKISDVSVVRRPAFPTSSAQLYARAVEEADGAPEISEEEIKAKDLVEVLKLRTRLYN
jgi:HK97 family phage prohead protease